MSNPTETLGLNAITYTDPVQIFATPIQEDDAVIVNMKQGTYNLKRGQIVAQTIVSGSPVTSPIATAADFTGATSPCFVLLEDCVTTNTTKYIKAAKYGTLIGSKLTPSDIPTGTYYNGQFTITKEIN